MHLCWGKKSRISEQAERSAGHRPEVIIMIELPSVSYRSWL
jgi:hypothetical protein